MDFINEQLCEFKRRIEEAIRDGGAKGKESVIRSQSLINLIHDAVKHDLIANGVSPVSVMPAFGETKPEMKIAGFLKQKDQDVCAVPLKLKPKATVIDWGPLAFEKKTDPYGMEYSKNTLVINVRSQMSSLAKNSDTLFERTFAEALNLHMRYPDMVLGDVYLIPTHEYDDELVKKKKVGFKDRATNIEKYISFFNSINNRKADGPNYAYERCALLIVDFSSSTPRLFKNSDELKQAHLLRKDFNIEYSTLNYNDFIKDILKVYSNRHDINNIKR